MHAPVLHFARLRYDTPLNHATCASALLKIATPRTSYLTQCPTTLYIYLSCGFYSQERQQKDRHRISQVGISDKRLAITPNQVGRHTERYRLVMCLSPAAAVSERVGHQVIVFGGRSVFGVALLAWSSVAIACMGIASPSATLTGMFSRMPPAKNQSSAQEKDAPIRHGFGRF